jgi:hypothetical protein
MMALATSPARPVTDIDVRDLAEVHGGIHGAH